MDQKLRKINRWLFPFAIVFTLISSSIKLALPTLPVVAILPCAVIVVWTIALMVLITIIIVERNQAE